MFARRGLRGTLKAAREERLWKDVAPRGMESGGDGFTHGRMDFYKDGGKRALRAGKVDGRFLELLSCGWKMLLRGFKLKGC